MARDGSLPYTPAGRQATASWWARVRTALRGSRARRRAAHHLYVALVEQSRQPLFYERWGVPDSRDGRLEMVTLHAMLVMRRLRREGPVGEALAEELFTVLFADLDRHLREWGVGDLSVGKQMRKLAESFFGRVTAIDPVLSQPDPAALADILRRNVYSEVADVDPAAVASLGHYLTAQDRWLAIQDSAELLDGRLAFAPATEQGTTGGA
jgi:cytochrome b pre-mRNA-processing protein 3